ncbi:hypothetical protein OG225_11745 [Nocardia sp. NBC_01377]|uniref:hypothetical protein n=1 Tax=Nocardia sp. NBC_01377 TaxID=2903595 RepID=UPI00325402E9
MIPERACPTTDVERREHFERALAEAQRGRVPTGLVLALEVVEALQSIKAAGPNAPKELLAQARSLFDDQLSGELQGAFRERMRHRREAGGIRPDSGSR